MLRVSERRHPGIGSKRLPRKRRRIPMLAGQRRDKDAGMRRSEIAGETWTLPAERRALQLAHTASARHRRARFNRTVNEGPARSLQVECLESREDLRIGDLAHLGRALL